MNRGGNYYYYILNSIGPILMAKLYNSDTTAFIKNVKGCSGLWFSWPRVTVKREKSWPKMNSYILVQTLKKENGKNKSWCHVLKSSHLVKKSRIGRVREQVSKRGPSEQRTRREGTGEHGPGVWACGGERAARTPQGTTPGAVGWNTTLTWRTATTLRTLLVLQSNPTFPRGLYPLAAQISLLQSF